MTIHIVPGIGTQLATPSTGNTKQYTVGTTSIKLDNISTKTVTIKADDDNSGNVYICINKDPCTTDTGFRLKAGQGISIDIDNLSKITTIADVDNQKIHVMWVK